MATSRSGVLCAGTVVVDVAKVIDAYPSRQHLATIEEVSLSTGGPGLNLAVDLRLLGSPFPVDVLGVVGADAHGDLILAECARLGIGAVGLQRLDGAVTSFTDCMVERDGGRRTFFHHVGANARFAPTAADLQRSRARILHVGAPGLHPGMDDPRSHGGNGWSELLSAARELDMRTNMELVTLPSRRLAELAEPCLPLLDTVVINEVEAGALVGVDVEAPGADEPVDWAALEKIARAVVGRGVRQLAVVHFPAGCVAAAPSGRTWRQGSVRLHPDEVVSTTGAGDAFAAGVVLGLHEGWPVEQALRQGVAAAAACVRDRGTSSGVLPAAECLVLADRAGYHQTRPS